MKLFDRQRWSERDNPKDCLERRSAALITQIESWSDDEIYSLNSVAAWHPPRLHDLRAADEYRQIAGVQILGARPARGRPDQAAAGCWYAGSHVWSTRKVRRAPDQGVADPQVLFISPGGRRTC